MFILSLLLLGSGEESSETLGKKMLPVYVREAEAYSISVELDGKKKETEFKKEPIFEWSNPVRQGVQQGAVFLWLRDGRPAAIASIFSQPHDKPPGRQILHEFHALDLGKLVVTRGKGALNQWKPEVGLSRKELTDSPVPAATPAARLIQMRKLAQEFSGHETEEDGKQWDLRLLPAPLYRYPAARTGVIDGALFTLVSSAGTDEAKETDGKTHWEYALGRFSDRNLYVKRNDKDLWSMVRSETNTFNNDPQQLYRFYADKIVSLEGKVLARVRITDKVRWGEIVPIDEEP
jgi:hypothetical protein